MRLPTPFGRLEIIGQRTARTDGLRLRLGFDTILLIAVAVYAIGVWLHIPYGGGRVYSDIVTVFQSRLCPGACTSLPVPYLQAFVEYPIGTSFFMYAMGVLGSLVPGDLLGTYYLSTSLFLAIPTLILVRELRLIAIMRGVRETRLLWFFIITPTFLFMLLLNWYILGACLSVAAIRQNLLGRQKTSGLLIGLSAVANLVSAAPALGLLLAERKPRNAIVFLAAASATWVAANLPVYLLNPQNWLAFWSYQYSWYIEGSWMEIVIPGLSPLRHVVPWVLFGGFIAAMLLVRFKAKDADPLNLSFLATFAFIFSTYVYTPQMNVLLLPFFVLLPFTSWYLEFLAFDIINSAIIVVGFSGFLQLLGLHYSVAQFGPTSPIQLMGVIRSLWVGKFLIYNGLVSRYLGTATGAWRRLVGAMK